MKQEILNRIPKDIIKNIKALEEYITFCLENHVENSTNYTENHHILPKSIFPEYKDLIIHCWNKATLSYEHHYIAHSLIISAFNSKKLIYGWWLMNGCKGKFKGRPPETLIGADLYKALKEFYHHENKNRDKTEYKRKAKEVGEDGLTRQQRAARKRGTESFKKAAILGVETARKNNSYIKREPLRQKTLHTKKENGLTPSEEKGIKISVGKLKIMDNGKNVASNAAPKGLDNHNTIIVDIFNPFGDLIHTIPGSFYNFCIQKKMPHRKFQQSYLNNTIINSKKSRSKRVDQNIDWEGWYAKLVSRDEYLTRVKNLID